jgi:steroid 5-alpha reductase family enzyme
MWKQKHFIDSHKLVTAVAMLLLMAWFNRWENPTAWVYLALHGTYGILWAIKSQIFPDKQFEKATGLPFGLFIWVALTLYWVSGILINLFDTRAPYWLLALAVSMNIFGTFFHFVTDMQKYVALRLNPGHLISDGMLSRVRNMNYFGELLIYLSFALLSMHWLPLLILFGLVLTGWLPNMRRKDQSLSRYPGFAEYRKKTRLFLPFFF